MNSKRINAGVPTGGQFAVQAHTEAVVALDPIPPVPAPDPQRPRVYRVNGYATAGLPAPLPDQTIFTAPTGDINDFDEQVRRRVLAVMNTPRKEQGAAFVGTKYAGKHQPAADIAKKLRADLKAAQAEGALPAGAKFSVTSRSFSGGQAIDVEIRNLPDNQTSVVDDRRNHVDRRESAAGQELNDTVSKMLNAYQRDNSDVQSDHFDVQFYGHVNFEHERARDAATAEKWARAEQSARTEFASDEADEVRETYRARNDYRGASLQLAWDAVTDVWS